MSGLRLTLRRNWPAIFAKHPIPWRMVQQVVTREYVRDVNPSLVVGQMMRSIRDANDHTVSESDYNVVVQSRLMDLYDYVMPIEQRSQCRMLRFWVPMVLLRHPTPWTRRLNPDRLVNRNGDVVMRCSDASEDVVQAMLDLAAIAAVRMREQERTIGFGATTAAYVARQRLEGYRDPADWLPP
jgi:hypothetical protein